MDGDDEAGDEGEGEAEEEDTEEEVDIVHLREERKWKNELRKVT